MFQSAITLVIVAGFIIVVTAITAIPAIPVGPIVFVAGLATILAGITAAIFGGP